jgi:Flp pilus assembly protein TadD
MDPQKQWVATELQKAQQHFQNRQFPQAEACVRQVLERYPDQPDALWAFGSALVFGRNDFTQGIGYLTRAASLAPVPWRYVQLARLLYDQGQFGASAECWQRLIAMNPQPPLLARAHLNLGRIAANDPALAISQFQRAIQLAPDYALAHHGLAEALLKAGDWTRGWPEYVEWHTRVHVAMLENDAIGTAPPEDRHMLPARWTGDDLTGKRVLFAVREGFGDTIMLARYVPLLAERGAKVVLSTYPNLRALLGTLEGVHEVLDEQSPGTIPFPGRPGLRLDPSADYFADTWSVPMAFGTTPNTIPFWDRAYLKADPTKQQSWRTRLGDSPRMRVGIAWWSDPMHVAVWGSKSTDLATFAPLSSVLGVELHGLQLGKPAEQIKTSAFEVIDHAQELTDFSETAALIANLDLVISIDTAVCHLAGAMGKQVWTLLPDDHFTEWRWMTDRRRTVWYESMRLFRQPAPGAWSEVMQEVAEHLRRQATAHQAEPQ